MTKAVAGAEWVGEKLYGVGSWIWSELFGDGSESQPNNGGAFTPHNFSCSLGSFRAQMSTSYGAGGTPQLTIESFNNMASGLVGPMLNGQATLANGWNVVLPTPMLAGQPGSAMVVMEGSTYSFGCQ